MVERVQYRMKGEVCIQVGVEVNQRSDIRQVSVEQEAQVPREGLVHQVQGFLGLWSSPLIGRPLAVFEQWCPDQRMK